MSDSSEQSARVKPRSLAGVLAFLAKYPRQVALCVGLLFVNICIELSLPQILGTAITDLGLHRAGEVFPIRDYVQLFLVGGNSRGRGFHPGPDPESPSATHV